MNKLKKVLIKYQKKSNTHKLSSNNPFEIIEWINNNYPELKDLCVYDAKEKILKSKKPKSVNFYFDPFHNALDITVYGTQ